MEGCLEAVSGTEDFEGDRKGMEDRGMGSRSPVGAGTFQMLRGRRKKSD